MEVSVSPLYRWMIFHFGGGDAFFFGIALVVLAVAFVQHGSKRWRTSYSIAMALLGLVWILLSSIPINIWVAGFGLSSVILWIAFEVRSRTPVQKSVKTSRLSVMVCAIAVCLLEAPHHFRPAVSAPVQAKNIFVVGDSVSAGMNEKEAVVWPLVLQQQIGPVWKVINLAQPGATVRSALKQADKVGDGFVVLEIGGNDILGPTSAQDFETHLHELLDKVCQPNRIVVMMELPLPPLCQKFAESQRRLAAEHQVVLLPRREFVRILAAPGATIDGIHLSQVGHDMLANLFKEWLSLPLRPIS